jgi:hypothetical protein
MGLRRIPYRRLQSLVRAFLKENEEEDTAAVIRELRAVRTRGYLTRKELERICQWKSPRAIRHIRSNSPAKVKGATRRAFETRIELKRLDALCELKGVSIPMASAILTLTNPKRYGVIDIRVWQVLYQLGSVTKNAGGIGFSGRNWYQYLMILRYLSKKLGVTAREVERAIFSAHHAYQKGKLYSNGRISAR